MVSRFGLGSSKDLRQALIKLATSAWTERVLVADSRIRELRKQRQQGGDIETDTGADLSKEEDKKEETRLLLELSDIRKHVVESAKVHSKLYPSGIVVLIPADDEDNEGEAKESEGCQVADNSFFDELVLSKQMFSVHMPCNYVRSMEKSLLRNPSASSRPNKDGGGHVGADELD